MSVPWPEIKEATMQNCACCRKEPAVLKERDLGWVCSECWVYLTAAEKWLRRVGIEGCTRVGEKR